MKSATIPPLRVTPELREAVEGVLAADESLSAFLKSALVRQIEFRKMHQEFIARGLAARDASKESGNYVGKDESLKRLDAILAKHRSSE